MPKVSVIIPTYNRAKLIARAIDSVLNQSYQGTEIIIIDDGSTDNTKEVLESYKGKIIYLYQQNKGIASARNKGLEIAKGKYIAFLDSDDIWIPEKLSIQTAVLDADIKIGLVYSRMPILNEKDETVGMKPQGKICGSFQELLETRGDIPTSTIMTRRECLDKVGVFDDELYIGEDTELWLRISQFYGLYEVKDKHLAYYYRHEQQSTKNLVRLYTGLINTDHKVMNYFKEAPRKIIKRNIARNEYCLAKVYYDQADYKKCLHHLLIAFQHHFFLSFLFINEQDSLPLRMLKLLNPIGLLMMAFIKSLILRPAVTKNA